MAPERNRPVVRGFLSALPILGLDEVSVGIFAETKALLERQGQRLADADLFIGAIAIAHGAPVVTGNRRHYERIPGIAIEDWFRSVSL